MNILEKIQQVLDMPNIKLGDMPNKPDEMIGLFEYSATPPEHSFSGTDFMHNVQVRTRAFASTSAYITAQRVVDRLNRYQDNQISILQATAILDIGRDSERRQEYTINFTVRRL